jgi:putative flippase GtrA
MALPDAGLYSRVRRVLPELIKFGVVGGVGSVIDLGGAAVLHSKYHVGPMESKAVSVTAATVFTYLGSRFWTFKDRENQSMGREAVLFIVLNVAGLVIAEAVLGFVTYIMGLRGSLEYNAASLLGTGLGTIFRFYAYRKWVFLKPAQPAYAFATAPAMAPFPDYPPWELDPAYQYAAPVEAAAQASTYSPWQPAAEQRAWQPAPEHRQPWMEKQVTLPNERLASPILTAHASTAPVSTGQDIGQDDPLSSGPRAQGRHRKQ